MPYWDKPELLSGAYPPKGAPGGDLKPELGLCVLHTGLVSTLWAFRMLQMGPFLPPFIFMPNRNQPYDTARDQATRAVLEKGVKWVFHLDSDVLMPLDGIKKMIEWSEKFNLPVISGLYWAKKPMKIPCAWAKVGEDKKEKKYAFMPLVGDHDQIKRGNIIPVSVVGAGALLIKADVFKKLDESNPDKPYFDWGVGRKIICEKCGHVEPMWQMSEDFSFCMRVINELDITPHLATAVKCDHITTVVRRGTDGEYELPLM